MLVSLSIRDFVLIEKLDLIFARGPDSGLGALTGEGGPAPSDEKRGWFFGLF
jgi:DNA repair protein RecN (Recombination protein N)